MFPKRGFTKTLTVEQEIIFYENWLYFWEMEDIVKEARKNKIEAKKSMSDVGFDPANFASANDTYKAYRETLPTYVEELKKQIKDSQNEKY